MEKSFKKIRVRKPFQVQDLMKSSNLIVRYVYGFIDKIYLFRETFYSAILRSLETFQKALDKSVATFHGITMTKEKSFHRHIVDTNMLNYLMKALVFSKKVPLQVILIIIGIHSFLFRAQRKR